MRMYFCSTQKKNITNGSTCTKNNCLINNFAALFESFTEGSIEAQWEESFSKHLWLAFVVVFLAQMGRIPCCGRPESSSSNI